MSLYLQIAENFKKQIMLGTLAASSKLPQEIELAKTLSVTRKTLRNALGVLEKEKLIIRNKRVGTFIAADAKDKAQVQFEIYVAGDFKYPESTNFFLTSLDRDNQTTEAYMAVQKLLARNISLKFISSRGISVIPKGTDGFLVIDSIRSANLLKLLADNKVPHISFEAHVNYPGVNTVMANDADAVVQCVNKLYQKGHRKIAFLGGAIKEEKFNTGIRRRTNAFKEKCNELDMKCEQWIYNFDESVNTVPDFDILTNRLLMKNSSYSAVICALGKGAISFLNIAKRKGIKVPDDIEMTCVDACTFDMLPNEIEMLKKYPCFVKPREKIATKGIKRLFDWIGNSNYKPRCYKEAFIPNN